MCNNSKICFNAVSDTDTSALPVLELNLESLQGAWKAPHFRSPVYSTATCHLLGTCEAGNTSALYGRVEDVPDIADIVNIMALTKTAQLT